MLMDAFRCLIKITLICLLISAQPMNVIRAEQPGTAEITIKGDGYLIPEAPIGQLQEETEEPVGQLTKQTTTDTAGRQKPAPPTGDHTEYRGLIISLLLAAAVLLLRFKKATASK